MNTILVFAILSSIIFIGFFSEIIFKKTNIPDVLILICLGIVLGPVTKFVTPESFGAGASLFTTFALAFILFQGAINIDFKTLIESLPSTLKLTILNFFFTTLVITILAAFILNYDPLMALMVGAILGGTSSAVVIPLVNNVEIRKNYGLALTLESAISDVLCIVSTITILEICNTGEFVIADVFKNLFSSFSIALLIGLFAGLGWAFMIYYKPDLQTSYIVTIAIIMGLYAFIESPLLEASGAIGILAFGLVLGNSKSILSYKEQSSNNVEGNLKTNSGVILNVLSPSSKTFYSEISFFVKTFFFVYLGIVMDFSNPMVFVYGAILATGIYLIRPLVVGLAFFTQRLTVKERTILEVLIPKGLAAAVLAQLVFQSGVLGERAAEFVSIMLSVVFISIILTSVLIFLTEKDIFKGFFAFLRSKDKNDF